MQVERVINSHATTLKGSYDFAKRFMYEFERLFIVLRHKNVTAVTILSKQKTLDMLNTPLYNSFENYINEVFAVPEKIAVLVDSCTDVPGDIMQKYGVFCVPLMVNYSYGQFRDGIDITAQEVYDSFECEIPKTSMPGAGAVSEVFAEIAQKGFTQVIAVTISSGLSGTNNVFHLAASEFPQLDCRIIDTRNIGIGAGLTAIRACEMVEEGLSLDEIEQRLNKTAKHTKIFFCVATLEYLKKGGRIGLVSATMGTLLGILPVISCNDDGVYYTVKKARGRKSVLESAVELAKKQLGNSRRYNIAVAHGGAPEEAQQIAEKVKALLPNYNLFVTGQISPALVVHTGPGLIGIGVQPLD